MRYESQRPRIVGVDSHVHTGNICRQQDQGSSRHCADSSACTTHQWQRTLLAPGARARVADGGKGRDRSVGVRVAQADDERAVAPHAVAHDRCAGWVEGALLLGRVGTQEGGQLGGDIGVHSIVLGPHRLCGVHVEARACSVGFWIQTFMCLH